MRCELLAVVALLPGLTGAAAAETVKERQARQAELDQKCEAARQVALAPRRQEIYAECIDRFGKEEDVCRKDANAYNGTRIGASPLFYDLPECVEAFEYRKAKDQ
ncbi:MAG: hypothetical protein ACM36C_13950 [Acidobacteriota bacterium]